jgi:ribosomal protein S18 acetylase RimI-like enzyme
MAVHEESKPMNPTFAPADTSDTDLVVELMREFYAAEHLQFDDQIARQSLRQILTQPSYGFVHLIRIGREVAGYIVLTFGFSLEFHGRDALLDEIYLRENFRGKGVGRASLRFVEKVCRGEGIKAVHLVVEKSNRRAQAVYRKAGYREHDRHLLTKWLNGS